MTDGHSNFVITLWLRFHFRWSKSFSAVAELAGDVAGLLGALGLSLEGVEDFSFDHLAAFGVDGVGDVAVHFDAVADALRGQAGELGAALVAVASVEVVFAAALRAGSHDFS